MIKTEIEKCVAPCQNLAYQELCVQMCESVPCCAEVCKNHSTQLLPSLSEGLVVQAFDLGKTITQKGLAKFRARGTCNYPCVRPGDILHVDTRDAKQIQIGDIVVYRRSQLLFSHRAVDKGTENGLYYIVTQSDIAKEDDGPVFDKDILGVVTNIERNGKLISPERKRYPLSQVFSKLRYRFYILRQFILRSVFRVIVRMQQFRPYRSMARFVFPGFSRKMDFSIRTSLNSKKLGWLYRKFSPQEFAALDLSERENMALEWKFAMSVDSRIVASLSVVFRPEYCPFSGCWISEMKTRTKYRGTNVETKLFEKVSILIKQLGISKILAGYSKGDSLRKTTLKDFGFGEADAGEDTLSMIILQKEI